MQRALTDITLVVDRSGSMNAIREDAEGGINAFIREQAEQPGEALLTLVQFDTDYEFVHKARPLKEVPPYQLIPRGLTAMLDAVGRAIGEAKERTTKQPAQERPGLVIFVVMTDGLENSSREFSKSQVRELIDQQQREHEWQFLFLGANQDAFQEAGALGIDPDGISPISAKLARQAYRSSSTAVARMRAQRAAGQKVKGEFTKEERQQME